METYIKELDAGLRVVLQKLHEELQGIRGNRPSVQLVEDIKVDYYGQPLTVRQLGSLSIRLPREIEINVWDKAAVNAVVKAIQDSKTGFSISNDGNLVRASLPPLTDERRTEISKLAKKIVESVRIQIRSRRDETIKKLKQAEDEKKLSEDQVFKGKEKVQEIVDEVNDKVEEVLGNKLRELSE